MALIDEKFEDDKEKKEDNNDKCYVCKSHISHMNKQAMICESCFNKEIDETLKKIDENIYKIEEEIKKVNSLLKAMQDETNKTNNIILQYRLEIDMLNGNATLMKYKIDLDFNKLAYLITQQQANNFRKLSNWQLFEINNKYNATLKKE